jgi:Pyruvate/2-oxoacid:ferredoxin oxidoreductase delta subunit
MVKDGKPTGVHYGYCKGCGICAQVCPKEAIVMEEERK